MLAKFKPSYEIFQLFKKIRPHIVHLVTIKPVLFGGIAARLALVPGVIVAISGLGYVFVAKGWKATITRFLVAGLYRFALGKNNLKVVCQNPDDRETLIKTAGLSFFKVAIIPGSGVDLSAYSCRAITQGCSRCGYGCSLAP